ncbi:MAG: MATE family efflux transporter, partial [Acutalibacter sp.]
SLAVPAITAQVVNMLYNIVDRIYIGHIPEIGTAALTGVGITFPIITLISAFSSLIAMGGAPRASIAMGAHHKERAEEIMGNCFTALLALSVALTAVFQIFQEPILWAFGASENTIGYAMDYMGIYVWGTVFVQISLGMNMFITSQGFAKTSMLTVIIGAALNILLDPVFIFVFDMGVRGAAIATVFSQAVSAVWVLLFLCGKRTTLKIRPRCMAVRWKVLLPVLGLGVSPFIMQSTESLLSVVLNTSLLKYGGDTAVGAYTVIASIMQVVNLPLQGLTQGAQPITSYNYGARNMARVRKSVRLLLTCTLTDSCLFWAAIMLIPPVFVGIFTSDPDDGHLCGPQDFPLWRVLLWGLVGLPASFWRWAGQVSAAGAAAEDRAAHPLIYTLFTGTSFWGVAGTSGHFGSRHHGVFLVFAKKNLGNKPGASN